jgi:rhodanese-related sulfurtransferase
MKTTGKASVGHNGLSAQQPVLAVLPQSGRISIETARALIANGALLVDVRSEYDYEKDGGIENAVNIPLTTIGKGGEKDLPRDRTIVLYCQMGQTSIKAMNALLALGINSCSLDGGISAWKKSHR